MESLRSVAFLYPKCIDARKLHVEMEYFFSTREQTNQILQSFVMFCSSLFSTNFILRWTLDNRVSKPEKLYEEIITNANCFLGVEGVVGNDRINNSRDLAKYIRNIYRPHVRNADEVDIPADYWDFFRSLQLTPYSDAHEWKSAMLSIFRESNRIPIVSAPSLDMCAYATRMPYLNRTDLFYGSISLYVCLYSLGDHHNHYAMRFVDFLMEQSAENANINGRIALTPLSNPSLCSGHMKYFGQIDATDKTHQQYGLPPRYWNSHRYLCGSEWFNVISLLAQENLPGLMEASKNTLNLFVRQQSNGSSMVGVNRGILETDINDLAPLKQLLYNALYPGYSNVPKSLFLDPSATGLLMKPRMLWERVPIFDKEIIISDNDIIFRHI